MVIEVTCRTIQGRHLLRPSSWVNLIITGIIGRALALYHGVKVIEFTILSNHYHFIILVDDELAMARFMGYVNSQLAKKVAAKIHGWNTKTWSRRYDSIPILDPIAQEARMRYVIAQGLHHNLVEHPCQWPGLSSIRARIEGRRLLGLWYDETAIYNASRRKGVVDPDQFAHMVEIELVPMPCWAHLSEKEYREKLEQMVVEVVLDEHERWAQEQSKPIGAAAVLSQDPLTMARKFVPTPAPLCHTSSQNVWKRYRRRLSVFHSRYSQASGRLRRGERTVEFPLWCFPPALSYVGPSMASMARATIHLQS